MGWVTVSWLLVIIPTIMDKILGTNLHLWRFFSHYTCSAPHPTPPPPPYNVGHVYTLFLQSFNIVWGGRGEATHFEMDNGAFLKLHFKSTEN